MTHLFQLERFDLSELVQLQATRPTPSLITLQNRRLHTGHIGLHDGQLTYARTDDEEGKDALFTIFSWEIPSLLRLSSKPPPLKNIDASLEQLLFEAYWHGEELRLMRAMQDTLHVPRDTFAKLLMKTIPTAFRPPAPPRAEQSQTRSAPTGLPKLHLPTFATSEERAAPAHHALRRARHQARLDHLDRIVRDLYEDSDAQDGTPIPLAARPALIALDEPTTPMVEQLDALDHPEQETPHEALPFHPVPCLRLDALESMYGELSELQEVSELLALRFDED